MALTPLTDADEIRDAYQAFTEGVLRGTRPADAQIGWQGGAISRTVHWNPSLRIWAYFDAEYAGNRYWCIFGTDDPSKANMLSITCEINPPHVGVNRRCAGVLARGDEGRVYLAHTGKVGGGRKGIGRSQFRAFYDSEMWMEMLWPNGAKSEVMVVGAVAGTRLREEIAHFVGKVDDFKHAVSDGTLAGVLAGREAVFSPEFSGPRRSYEAAGTVESRCRHGAVINALERKLKQDGHHTGNDTYRDLFVQAESGQVVILFEAKTDLSLSSTYSAIGQLMFHGAGEEPSPVRVLVIPGAPEPRTAGLLDKLGIETLIYSWEGEQPVFERLAALSGSVTG